MARASVTMNFDMFYQIEFKTAIRGHHVYKQTWTPSLGEILQCKKDNRQEVGLVIPVHYKARTKSRSHCKILDRELNHMKTKYSHFETEHELSEERILMPYVTSSK